MQSKAKYRPDVNGPEEATYRKNRAYLFKTGEVCAICGGYIDKTLPFPHPLSKSVDHIIPVSKGGKSTLDNLQLTHLQCNKAKGVKITEVNNQPKQEKKQQLPQYFDWSSYGN